MVVGVALGAMLPNEDWAAGTSEPWVHPKPLQLTSYNGYNMLQPQKLQSKIALKTARRTRGIPLQSDLLKCL